MSAVNLVPEKGEGATVGIAPESFAKLEGYSRQEVLVTGTFKKDAKLFVINTVNAAKVVKGTVKDSKVEGKPSDIEIELEGGAGSLHVAPESAKRLEGMDKKYVEAIGFMDKDGKNLVVDYVAVRKTVKGEVFIGKNEGKVSSIVVKGGKESENIAPSSFGKLEAFEHYEITMTGFTDWDGKYFSVDSVSEEKKKPQPKKK